MKCSVHLYPHCIVDKYQPFSATERLRAARVYCCIETLVSVTQAKVPADLGSVQTTPKLHSSSGFLYKRRNELQLCADGLKCEYARARLYVCWKGGGGLWSTGDKNAK